MLTPELETKIRRFVEIRNIPDKKTLLEINELWKDLGGLDITAVLLEEIDTLREIWRRDDNYHSEVTMQNRALLDENKRLKHELEYSYDENGILKKDLTGHPFS